MWAWFEHGDKRPRRAWFLLDFISVHLIDEILVRKLFNGRLATMKFTHISFPIHFFASDETIPLSRKLLSLTMYRILIVCAYRSACVRCLHTKNVIVIIAKVFIKQANELRLQTQSF